MHNELIKYINNLSSIPLNQEEIEIVKEKYTPKKLRRKQYFLQEGEVCKCMAFIVKGAMRQYGVDNKGGEHIVRFSIENWWAGDRESFLMLTPSKYNIDAWEDTEMLLVTKADMYFLNHIPAISEVTRKLDERSFIAAQNRISSLMCNTTEQRYENLINTYPEFIERFPQHQIASYLGITKETLSRSRKQIKK